MSSHLLVSESESKRLQLQAQVWQPAAETMLAAIGVQPGWSCLDLGCGAMGILGPLHQSVGPDGHVVGLDSDQRSLDVAQAYVHAHHLNNVALQVGNVLETGLPSDHFDLVHERFVLPYISSPESMLHEMLRLVRPGGWMAVQEADTRAWMSYPTDSRWSRFQDLMVAAFGLRGNSDIGQRAYGMLQDLGLVDLHVQSEVVALSPQHPFMQMPLMALADMRPQNVQQGLIQADELDALMKYVAQTAHNQQNVRIPLTTTQVWGRKPASTS